MRYALVGAGSVGHSFIAGMPNLARDLGPVAAGSYRLASRIVNTIAAGSPIKNIDALEASRNILICAPGGAFADVFGPLRDAKIAWRRKTLLVCDSELYSHSLAVFKSRGAATGSMNSFKGLADRFVIEGDRAAVRLAKQLARLKNAKTVELSGARVLSFTAAETISSSLFMPLIESCIQTLRDAGVHGMTAARVAEAMFEQSLRTYKHAGKKAWTGPVASGDEMRMAEEMEGLREWNPLLAEHYRISSVFALELFKRYPELAARLKMGAAYRRRPPAARREENPPDPDKTNGCLTTAEGRAAKPFPPR